MAGNTAYLEVDDKAARAALDRIVRFGDARLFDFFRDAGQEMENRTRWRAERQESPDGIPWVPLSPRYQVRKNEKRPGAPLLKFDFHMLGDMFSSQIEGRDLVWGTSAIWGATHQFGAPERGIPAREWLGLAAEDADALLDILSEHLAAAVAGR
jgi:phage virion morphogenesis protein